MPKYVKAIFSYTAQEKDEITFTEGEFLELYQDEGDWWEGKRVQGGPSGFFPRNRVQKVPGLPSGAAAASVRGNTTRRTKNTEFPNLTRSPPSDQIRKVSVVFKEFKRNKRTAALFIVEVTAKDGSGKVISEKSMTDFRQLHRSIVTLFPNFEALIVKSLPPRWADEIPLTTYQAKQRAKKLAKYLARNTKERNLFDMILITWATITKATLQKSIPRKGAKNEITLNKNDNIKQARDKILDALRWNYNYSSQSAVFQNEENASGDQVDGLLAQCKYEWSQQDDVEISLSELEYFLVTSQNTKYEGWWYGEKSDGKQGLFPLTSAYILESDKIAALKNEKKEKVRRKKRRTRNMGTSKKNTAGNHNSLGSVTSQLVRRTEARSAGPQAGAPPPGPARARKFIENFTVTDINAFDDLREFGVTLEDPRSAKRLDYSIGSERNKKGYLVVAKYDAYVWDPQTLTLREFASSDKLEAPPQGVEQGKAGISGFKLNTLIGSKEVNEGLELGLNQNACREGSPVRIIVAPFKGYGAVGSPPEIPKNCYLVYDITIEQLTQQTDEQVRLRPRDQVFSVGIARPVVDQNIRRKKKRN